MGRSKPEAHCRVLQRLYEGDVKPQCWRRLRSGTSKRTQKGQEGESTESGLSAVNDMSSEILSLLDSAQGVCMLENNISHRVLAS